MEAVHLDNSKVITFVQAWDQIDIGGMGSKLKPLNLNNNALMSNDYIY